MKMLRQSANLFPSSEQARSSIMHFVEMLLVFTALLTLAYSYPTGTEKMNDANFSQNVTNTTYDAQEDKKPFTIIVEDKNPKKESVLVQFIYNSNGGNSISESKGTDKERYNIDLPLLKDQPQHLNNSEKLASKMTSTEAQKQANEPKLVPSHEINEKVQTALAPEEVSPLSDKWPTYFYDAFNPVRPFPEMQYDTQNQIRVQKFENENTDSYLPYNEKERVNNVAGPLLSPLSIYDRELRVPIFV